MTGVSRCAIAAAATALLCASPARGEPAPSSARVLSLHITRAGETTVASCTLIARDEAAGAVNLYFVTAARMFVSDNERIPPVGAVIVDGAGRHLVIGPDDVIVPAGTLVDLALLRATVAASDLSPQALAFESPAPYDAFTISGVAADGSWPSLP